jgi:hypothetical protein
MIDQGGTFWALLLGSNALSSGIASAITARVTRKKDSGDQANDLVGKLIARVESLEKAAEAARADRAKEHEECEKQLRDLRHGMRNLILKMEVLRARFGVPTDEWRAADHELGQPIPAEQAELLERMDDAERAAAGLAPVHLREEQP